MDTFTERSAKSREEREFIEYNSERLVSFAKSKDEAMHLEPMNSFYRRLIHNLANRFNFKTESEGESRDRHIVLSKTKESSIPEDLDLKMPVWDWGEREFSVNPMEREVEVALFRNGSFGMLECNESARYFDRRKITTGSFKIKKNRIVTIEDIDW